MSLAPNEHQLPLHFTVRGVTVHVDHESYDYWIQAAPLHSQTTFRMLVERLYDVSNLVMIPEDECTPDLIDGATRIYLVLAN